MTDQPFAPTDCPRCGCEFTPRRSDQLFCVPECRKLVHQEERELPKLLLDAGIITRRDIMGFVAVMKAVDQTRPENPCTGVSHAADDNTGDTDPETRSARPDAGVAKLLAAPAGGDRGPAGAGD